MAAFLFGETRMAAAPEQIVKEVYASVEAIKKNQESLDSKLKEVVEKKADKDVIERAEALAKEISAHSARIIELEQKLAEGVKIGKTAPKTLGQLVIESDSYKQYANGFTTKMRVEANTIIGQEGSPLENSNTIVAPDRLPGIVPGAFRALRLRDVIPSGVTASNAIEYTRENVWTNNAAETAEAASKPESSLTFELLSAPVRTVAHWIKASKQVLEDAPMLASYIDTRMRYGVEYRIDSQLLNGNGTGQNISGLTDTGNYTAFNPVTGDDPIDSINRAIYAVIAADYAPTAILLNPVDWGSIERSKASGSGEYVFGDPGSAVGPRLWGYPVVVTNAMTQGKFMVAAFDIAAQVFNRRGVVVEMFEQDGDNVQKNLVTIRAEARLALAIYRPASIRYGDLKV